MYRGRPDPDRLTGLLVDCDEALARGLPLPLTPDTLGSLTPGDADALRRELACLRFLGRVWPRRAGRVDCFDSPTLTAAPALPEVPGYAVLEEVGRGGMGVVYKARQFRPSRILALKTVRAGGCYGDEHLRRFRVEAEALARVRHPNIAQVYEVGEAGGQPYYTLELCPGGSLAQLLQGGPLVPERAARLLALLAEALHAAHERGVIHRDLKPANVLFAQDGTPKVVDFGLAKLLDAEPGPTRSGELLGTPSYMAPEQAAGQVSEVGPATDVYALGAIFYELLTGRPPFRAPTAVETVKQVIDREPLRPRQLQPAVPRDLETICLKCLEKQPARRYASAGALGEDVRRFLDGRPILARPVGALGRGWRWCRRHKALTALYAVSALAAALLLAAGLWFSSRLGEARAERQAAQTSAAAAEKVAQADRYFGLVHRARERAARPRAGWTWAALTDLAAAGQLPAAADKLAELRTEAAGALGAVDVRRVGVLGKGFVAYSIAWHPGGELLALGGRAAGILGGCQVLVLDLRAPGGPRRLPVRTRPALNSQGRLVPDHVNVLAFSPDGRWLVAGMRSGALYRWEVCGWDGAGPCPAATPLAPAHEREVRRLAFAADGAALYSAAGTVLRRWALDTGKPTATFTAPAGFSGLAVHPAEGWLACAAGPVHALHPDTLQPVRPGFERPARLLQFTADGRLAHAAERSLELTESQGAGSQSFRPPGGDHAHDDSITDLAVSPGGELILSASESGKQVRLWERASGGLVATLLGGGRSRVAFAPDGRRLAVTAEGETHLYEVGGLREQTVAAPGVEPLRAFALLPCGRSLVAASPEPRALWEAKVALWPLRGEPARAPLAVHSCWVGPHPAADPWALAAAPASPLLALVSPRGGRSYAVTVCDGFGRPTQGKFEVGAPLDALQFAPDGRLWETAGGEIRIREAPGGQAAASWNNRLARDRTGLPELYGLAVGRRWAVAGGRDGAVRIFAAPVPAEPVRQARTSSGGGPLEPHATRALGDTPLWGAALLPGEGAAALGADDGRLVVVRLPDGTPVTELAAHGDRVESLAATPSGLLASACREGLVRLWRWDGATLRGLFTLRHARPVRQVAFAADGVTLAVRVDGERAVRLWHLDRLCGRFQGLGLGAGLEALTPTPLPPGASAPPPAPPHEPPAPRSGLRAELFADADLARCVKVRYDPVVDFSWGAGAADPALPADFFSVRWSGWLKAPGPGRYRLRLQADDGARLWLDGKLAIDLWPHGIGVLHRVEVELTDRPHAVRIEYREGTGSAAVRFLWARPGGFDERPVGPGHLFPSKEAAGTDP
jgi:WD40 repeat protein